MSAHDNEELIDYEDEHDVVTNGAPATAAANGAASAPAADGDDKEKKNFSGIHSTGFRYVASVGGDTRRPDTHGRPGFVRQQGFPVEARVAASYQ